MRADASGVEELQVHYADLIENVRAFVRNFEQDAQRINTLRAEYAVQGFVKVDAVLPAERLRALTNILFRVLRPVAEEVVMLQRQVSDTQLSDGSHFRRIDPYTIHQAPTREKLSLLLAKLGFEQFGSLLAAGLENVISAIAGPLRYERCYAYIYEEGDYISAHNDHHVGDRVDVQFPVSIDGVGGVRVLSEGLFKMYYDAAGSMNVLGPRVWHDVPPLVRSNPGIAPHRFNMGLRFSMVPRESELLQQA